MGISITQLLIVLAIVVLLFGTKRLKNIGSDLGSAIKGFKTAVKEGEEDNKLTDDDTENADEKLAQQQKDKV